MTAASWISNGEPLSAGMTALKPPKAARECKLGRFQVACAPRQGRWSISAGNHGVAGYRTLLGALLATRRLTRESAHL